MNVRINSSMPDNTIANITVLFSLSMSIRKWQAMGIFEKEMIIFSHYLKQGLAKEVSLFTYDKDDIELIDRAMQEGTIPNGFRVILAPAFVRNKLGAILYSIIGPLWHRQHFSVTGAVYSHQASGAWTGLISKFFYRRHFVYRYGHSLWRRHLDRRQIHRLALSWPLDRILSRFADYSLVCTKRDFDYAGQRSNSMVCPNFIDEATLPTTVNNSWVERENRAVFVGRLVSFKNLFALIEACARKNMPLDIIGGGPLEAQLRNFALGLGADCTFLGVLDNQDIQARLPTYSIFFLVSTYEGMPKSLLEGLACGCLCIVSPHYGCTEIVQDDVNGLVCRGYEVDDICDAIDRAKTARSASLTTQAKQDITQHYSLNRVIEIHRLAYAAASGVMRHSMSEQS